jgi:hypothetical protein
VGGEAGSAEEGEWEMGARVSSAASRGAACFSLSSVPFPRSVLGWRVCVDLTDWRGWTRRNYLLAERRQPEREPNTDFASHSLPVSTILQGSAGQISIGKGPNINRKN